MGGHLHCEFRARVEHRNTKNVTEFRAFDKFDANKNAPRRRRFVQIFDVDAPENARKEFEFDALWLSILRSTNHLMSLQRTGALIPTKGSAQRWDFRPTKEEIADIERRFDGD